MSAIIQGSQLRTLDTGILVTRAAANLPQTATQNIFTVSGGRILLTSFAGLVTSATGATVTSLSVGVVPTVGTSSATALAAAVAITSLEAGTMVVLPAAASGKAGGNLVVGTNASTIPQAQLSSGYLIPAGTITITTSASDTGQMQWDLTWIPFDDGVSVAAA